MALVTLEQQLQYCKDHQLPELFQSWLKQPSSHLNLFGGQHDLFQVKLTDEKLRNVVEVLVNLDMPKLVLDLGSNLLTDGCVEILKPLITTNLTGLSLKSNNITFAGIETFSKLVVSSQLKYLSFANNDLTPEGTFLLMKAIYESPGMHFGSFGERGTQAHGSLQYLDLQNTGFGERAAIVLGWFVQSRFCGLRQLNLSKALCSLDKIIQGIAYNTSLEALELRACDKLDDPSVQQLMKNLVADVQVNEFCFDIDEYQSKQDHKYRVNLSQEMKTRVQEQINVQQRQAHRQDIPRPLPLHEQGDKVHSSSSQQANTYLRKAVTPLRHIDLSSNNLSFDTCRYIAHHLLNQGCYLKLIALNGVNCRNQGANFLAQALLKYQPRALQKEYVDARQQTNIEQNYEFFGFIEPNPEKERDYDQHFRNITLQTLEGKVNKQVCLQLMRCNIGGQGLCTLALLAKMNLEISYVAVEGSTLNVEYGTGVNEGTVWDPMVEWESTFSVRSTLNQKLYTDFGLKRREADLKFMFYVEKLGGIHAIGVFE